MGCCRCFSRLRKLKGLGCPPPNCKRLAMRWISTEPGSGAGLRKPPLPLKAAAVVDMAAVADIMVAVEAEAVVVGMAVGVATTTAQAKRRAVTAPPDASIQVVDLA